MSVGKTDLVEDDINYATLAGRSESELRKTGEMRMPSWDVLHSRGPGCTCGISYAVGPRRDAVNKVRMSGRCSRRKHPFPGADLYPRPA